VTVDDIAWLASTPLGALTDALDDLRVSGYVDPAAARQLADMDTPRRRLVLAMSQLEDFPLVAGLAVAAALEDAAWIDTLTTLILDGTPVYEAIALARADHRIEQERVEQQRVVTVTRAVGPAGRAVTGSS
jgi:hypothetical protein